MRTLLRRLGKIAVACFVVWHALAVGIAALPTSAKDPISAWLRTQVGRYTVPYVSLTSQWQYWEFFSPDPKRRFQWYMIEREEHPKFWIPVDRITPDSFPWWSSTNEIRILDTIADLNVGRKGLQPTYLRDACRRYELSEDTRIRLVLAYLVLPERVADLTSQTMADLPLYQAIGEPFTCPAHAEK